MSRTTYIFEGEILLNPEGECAKSLTIRDGLIDAIDGSPPADAQIISLSGKYAVPGFVDSHLHLTLGAAGLGDVDVRHVTSMKMFQEALLCGASHVPADRWLVATGWSVQSLGEQPDRSWLSNLGEKPMICFSEDLHTAVVNDIILAILDQDHISAMQGGERLHEGIIAEDALFHGVGPLIPQVDARTKIARSKQAIREMHTRGITLIGTMEEEREIKDVLLQLQAARLMRMRVMCTDQPSPELFHFCNALASNDFLKVTGFKAFVDGTLGSKTAKMYEPWNDADGDGIITSIAKDGALQTWASTVASAGYAPVIHAIGDRAVGIALDALDAISSDLYPRIEHAQFIAEQDVQRIAHTWFGVQPLHQPGDALIATKAVGSTRAAYLHHWRRMLDAGAKLSFGSDWPVAIPDPIGAMKVAIEQGLTPSEAFAASTQEAAISLRTKEAGVLSIGHYGDVVILDRHPLTCDWKDEVPSVTMTILDGVTVYEKEPKECMTD